METEGDEGQTREVRLMTIFLLNLSFKEDLVLQVVLPARSRPSSWPWSSGPPLSRHPFHIFLKSWWLIHSKYDDRYLTLVILFTPVTLVTLFQSYIQFYRAECITVSGFFLFLWTPWHQKWEHRVCIFQTMSICNGYWILHSQASGRSVWSSLHIIPDVSAETRWFLGCAKFGSEFFLEMHYDPNW